MKQYSFAFAKIEKEIFWESWLTYFIFAHGKLEFFSKKALLPVAGFELGSFAWQVIALTTQLLSQVKETDKNCPKQA